MLKPAFMAGSVPRINGLIFSLASLFIYKIFEKKISSINNFYNLFE